MRVPSDQIIHKAAWLYYSNGLRQDEVAKALGLSRASVVNYLKRAKDLGAVTISLSTKSFEGDVLARQLEDRLGLQLIWIVNDDNAVTFPAVAGTILAQIIDDGDRLALAWGHTIYRMVEDFPRSDHADISVHQVCGNLGAPYGYRPEQCTVELAKSLNATAYNIYAPLVLSNERLAEELRSENMIAEQLSALAACNLAVFSVGTCTSNSHIVTCGAASAKQVEAYRKAGAASVVAGRLLNEDGGELDCDYNRRLIAISLDTLRDIKTKLVLVDDTEKVVPLLAAIRGGLATHLVITRKVADGLLARSS